MSPKLSLTCLVLFGACAAGLVPKTSVRQGGSAACRFANNPEYYYIRAFVRVDTDQDRKVTADELGCFQLGQYNIAVPPSFELKDESGDGFLTFDEEFPGSDDPVDRKKFAYFDTDQNGKWDWAEDQNYVFNQGKENIYYFDTNGDGVLSYTEFY